MIQGHRSHGEWREADMNTMRAAVLADSITLRDRNRQASEFEAQFKTQEARIALSEADAIRECTGGMPLSDFLDDWRIRHTAQMLADTDEPVGLVTEMSGFASRSHFSTLFSAKSSR
ncbi:MAG: hypothetical protein IJT19_07610 [Bacteroidaceae bacterium]|nr:hypothetical protein [Bacteroidaceae bacterium]